MILFVSGFFSRPCVSDHCEVKKLNENFHDKLLHYAWLYRSNDWPSLEVSWIVSSLVISQTCLRHTSLFYLRNSLIHEVLSLQKLKYLWTFFSIVYLINQQWKCQKFLSIIQIWLKQWQVILWMISLVLMWFDQTTFILKHCQIRKDVENLSTDKNESSYRSKIWRKLPRNIVHWFWGRHLNSNFGQSGFVCQFFRLGQTFLSMSIP